MMGSDRTGAKALRMPVMAVGVVAGLLLIASVPLPAQSAELVVSPKNEQTMVRSSAGKFSPRKLKYRLSTSSGKRKWTLKSYPGWFSADPVKGRAKKRTKQAVVFTPVKKKIDKLDPGIYSKKIQFSYTDGGEKKIVRRNVSLMIEGDPQVGLTVFQNKCSGCHDLNTNMSGPYLRDVYGRTAGTATGYDHSDELKAYGKVWEERTLNDWLANPQKLVPGAKMFLSLSNRADRMNVIAYLKSVSP